MISVRSAASMTTTLVAESETSTRAPSGVNASRFGSSKFRSRRSLTSLAATSMIDTSPSLRVATQSSAPSGDRSSPSGYAPSAGIEVTRQSGGPAAAPSTIDTVSDPRLAVKIVSRSRLTIIMWAPSCPRPRVQSTSSVRGS